MGTSTNGILFYGVDLGEWVQPTSWHYDLYEDGWEYEYLHRLGVKPDRDNWYSYQLVKQYFGGDFGINTHCSDEYPMYYIYGKKFQSRRGYSQRINEKDLMESKSAHKQVIELANALDIEIDPADIGWHLVSYWG